jgi:hypothetical protein
VDGIRPRFIEIIMKSSLLKMSNRFLQTRGGRFRNQGRRFISLARFSEENLLVGAQVVPQVYSRQLMLEINTDIGKEGRVMDAWSVAPSSCWLPITVYIDVEGRGRFLD